MSSQKLLMHYSTVKIYSIC